MTSIGTVKLLSLIRRMERAFLITIFLCMVALFFVNILVRTFAPQFASELAWVEEAVRLLNLFLVFGALGLALERGRHVSIDSLRERLPPAVRSTLYRCIDLIGLLACVYLAWLSLQLVRLVLVTGQRSPTLDIPMGWIYAAPLAGFSLLALRYALSLAQILDRRRKSAIEAADGTFVETFVETVVGTVGESAIEKFSRPIGKSTGGPSADSETGTSA